MSAKKKPTTSSKKPSKPAAKPSAGSRKVVAAAASSSAVKVDEKKTSAKKNIAPDKLSVKKTAKGVKATVAEAQQAKKSSAKTAGKPSHPKKVAAAKPVSKNSASKPVPAPKAVVKTTAKTTTKGTSTAKKSNSAKPTVSKKEVTAPKTTVKKDVTPSKEKLKESPKSAAPKVTPKIAAEMVANAKVARTAKMKASKDENTQSTSVEKKLSGSSKPSLKEKVQKVEKPEDYSKFKPLLLALRSRLIGDVDMMSREALGTRESVVDNHAPIHPAEVGSHNFEQEFTLNLLSNDGDRLEQIEAALEKLGDGSYGSCEECGSRIPKARLEIIPDTPFCVKCAAKLEG